MSKPSLSNRLTRRVEAATGAEQVRGTWRIMQGWWQQATRPAQTQRVETFDEAVARLGLSEAHLAGRARELRVMFLLFTGAFAVCLVMLVLAFGESEPLLRLARLLLAGGIGIFSLARMATLSFRAWQIRTRQLGGFSQWLADPAQWWVRGS